MIETSPRIAGLTADLESTGPGALEDFWRSITAAGTPLVEPLDGERVLVTFLWRGEADSTTVEWGIRLPLQRINETDLWYVTTALPADLRTLYYFSHDGVMGVPQGTGAGKSHVDPANPSTVQFPADPDDPEDVDSWASLLELDSAPAEPWSAAAEFGGTTVETEVSSDALGGTRHIGAHLPRGVPPDGLPVLVVFDGHISRTVLNIASTVDNLVAAGRIPPLVALFVNSPSDIRDAELSPRPPIAAFIADELLPWARQRWRVTNNPRDIVVAGASRGGLAAAYVALCRPDAVGAVIAQSGSFWWPSPDEGEPEWLTREYAARPTLPLRFYVEVGSREDGPGPGDAPSQVVVNRRFRDTLRARGYPVVYAEYTGAHDYVNWRRTFADGLIAMLGADDVARP